MYNDDRGNPPKIEADEAEKLLRAEIEKMRKKYLKTGKASGNDMVRSKTIKALDDTGVHIIHKLLNEIYKTDVIPSSMNESIFIRLPKKSKSIMYAEYRILSLMGHLLKVILKVILLRNKRKIEKEISILQSGFMLRKATREGISI